MKNTHNDSDKRFDDFIQLLQQASGASESECIKTAWGWVRLYSGLRRIDVNLRDDEYLQKREAERQAVVDTLAGLLQSIEKHAGTFDDLLGAESVRELEDHIYRLYRNSLIAWANKQIEHGRMFQRKRGRPHDPERQDRLTLIRRFRTDWECLSGRKATIQTPRDEIGCEPRGPILEILIALFQLFGLSLNPHTLKGDFYSSDEIIIQP